MQTASQVKTLWFLFGPNVNRDAGGVNGIENSVQSSEAINHQPPDILNMLQCTHQTSASGTLFPLQAARLSCLLQVFPELKWN